MISPLYMAMSSVYMTFSWLPAYAEMVEKGSFKKARTLANEATKYLNDPLAVSHMYQAAADMSILLNEYEKAEEQYERSVSILAGSEFLPSISCRATGIMSLVQNKLDIATLCFKRNAEQTLLIDKKIEGFAVLTMLFREAGLLNATIDSMSQMKEISESTSCQHWQPLVKLIELDLSIFKSIYGSPTMEDHIFRSVDNSYPLEKMDADLCIDRNKKNDLSGINKKLSSIIECRQNQLLNLKLLKNGGQIDFNHVMQFSHHPFVSQSMTYQKYSLLEIGLAAISGEQKNIIDELIINYPWMNYKKSKMINNTLRIDLNERLYFFGKLQNERGHVDSETNFYQLYIEGAFKVINQFTNKIQRLIGYSDLNNEEAERTNKFSKLNGVEKKAGSVPIKCQMAINYILKNQTRADISVYEVAAVIGVSERWLQLNFKNYYGCTPKKMIQIGRNTVLN